MASGRVPINGVHLHGISISLATTSISFSVAGLGAALEGGEATALIVEEEWDHHHCSKNYIMH